MNDAARLAWLQDNLGSVSGNLVLADIATSKFPAAVHRILTAAFTNAFAPRKDGQFVPLLQVRYSDSSVMVTVGGALLDKELAKEYKAKLRARIPFLANAKERLYEIASLHLTERERRLFDRAVTAQTKRVTEWNALRSLGFGDEEYRSYRDLVRYLPRYVETLV